MNCQSARENFSDLLDGRAHPGEHDEARAANIAAAQTHLANCPECQREFASLRQTLSALDAMPTPRPTPKLRREFYAMLEAEKHATPAPAAEVRATRGAGHAWWRWVLVPIGACTLLACGFLTGTRYGQAPAPAATTTVAETDTKRELRDLRAQVDRLTTMNQLVATSLQQQQRPASERLQTVLTSSTKDNSSDRLVDELIASLALDSSSNVRLRALEALYPYADKEVVRAAVLTSLPRETSPLVQVSMIDFLAAARDHEAKPALEKMSVNDHADADVRVAAKRALAQL